MANTSEFRSPATWRATAAEFIATLLFVFFGAAAVVVFGTIEGGEMTAARLVVIALTHGLAIMLLATATANISGGHINPAVTIGAMVTRQIGAVKGIMYIVAQLLGALVGAILLAAIVDTGTGLGSHSLGPGISVLGGVLTEIILTFTLVFVVFATAMDPKGLGSLAPVAIGLAVLVDHLAGVPLTGASMNPARSFGPAIVSGNMPDYTVYVYLLAPIIGGIIAALVYKYGFMNREE